MVKKNVQLRSPWLYAQSKQLCVILHYYTPMNAGTESKVADILIEYAGSHAKTLLGNLENSEVSFILNTHCYLI